MTGKIGSRLSVKHRIYSKTLYDSMNSKPKEEKTIRHLLPWIKQQKDEFKNVSGIEWISNQQMLTDILTKKGVMSDLLLAAVMRGRL